MKRKNPHDAKYGINWQDDSAASECRLCGKRFGTMRRRHHCRKCGQLVCHSCSLHRKQVDGSHHPKRVCDICAVVESERHSGREEHTGGAS